MKKTLIVVVVIFIGLLVFFWYIGRTERLKETSSAIEAVRGSESFPESVAGLPLSKVANSANQCATTPIQYCADYVEHRYISPNKTDPWAFRVTSAKLTSGDKAALKAAYIAQSKAVDVGGETVYLYSNGIVWFTNGKTADMVSIVLMPIDARSGTVGFGEITPSNVKSNSAFISTFLSSFPPQ